MNEFVQGAIDTRRRMLFDTYIISDPAFTRHMQEVFDEMTELGESCADLACFESAFTDSPVCARYCDLCAQAANRFPVRQVDTGIPDSGPAAGEIADAAARHGEALLDSATQPARRVAYEEARDQVESLPVIGDFLQASRTASVLRKWFKK